MKKTDVIKDLKALIMSKFHEDLGDDLYEMKGIVDGAVYTGEDDPGQWAPEAVAVIHCESGIPNGEYNVDEGEKWIEISDKLQEMGHNVFVETINPAVKAVYNL